MAGESQEYKPGREIALCGWQVGDGGPVGAEPDPPVFEEFGPSRSLLCYIRADHGRRGDPAEGTMTGETQ